MLNRVRKDIAFLERELRRMQILVNTLADIERPDALAKNWKDSMRDFSYDMEECIDRLMLRLRDGDAKPSFTKKAARRVKTLFAHHGIHTQIKELKARFAQESERLQRLNLDNYAPTTTVAIDPRLDAFHGEAMGLVAMDGRRDEVISLLTEQSMELKVVYIVGDGGLGKTTLAMETYRKIGGDFQCRASVLVSHTLDVETLLKDVLSQIDQDAYSKYQSERWDEDQLILEIQRILTGKRYFLVIDDVWKEQDWEFCKAVFPDNNNGSRIIVTTRIAKVAKSCCSSSGDQLYQMSPLNDADSRRLFIRRIFHSDSSCPPQLEEVLANILRKCGGLPMAIITIARLLANKTHKLEEWEGRLQESIGNGFSYESDDAVKNMRHTLLLSYWELPHYLKTCLLYLYIYPEGWYISCEELKWKWIAEGFIATQRGNLYLEAHNCFNELVNRSMIQLVDAGDDGFEKYCQVHDMVLHLIVSLSCEENFATVLNSVCNSLPSKIRRLSLHSNGLEQNATIHAITRSKPHVCSLNVFGETADMPPLVEFPSLRVFDICNGFSSLENEHIRNIGSLYQLRYLRTQGLGITEIPDDIGKLQNLEILDLRGTSIRKLPPTITRLHKLVCLFVDYHEFVFPADIFGSMRALEEVSDICKVDNPEKFLEELRHLTKLRKISMSRLWISRLDHHSLRCYRERLGSSLNEMGQYNLQCLHAVGKVGEYLFRDTCCTFPHLQDLKLGSCMLRVPKGMASLTNILKLQIEIAIFDEESLHILMEMPALAYLQLKVSKSAGIMTVSSTGFKLLEVFRYSIHEEEATGIEFAVGAMPTLRRLHLSWNAYYVMFRYNDGADMGIEHLSSLAHLEVETGCCNATLEEVEAVGASFEKAIALHPNRHTLQLHLRRKYEDKISKKREKERERRRRKGDYAPRSSISPQQQEDQVI